MEHADWLPLKLNPHGGCWLVNWSSMLHPDALKLVKLSGCSVGLYRELALYCQGALVEIHTFCLTFSEISDRQLMPLCYIHTHNTWHCLFLGQPSWIPVCTYNKHGRRKWIYVDHKQHKRLVDTSEIWRRQTGKRREKNGSFVWADPRSCPRRENVAAGPILPCYPIVVQSFIMECKEVWVLFLQSQLFHWKPGNQDGFHSGYNLT